MSIPRFVLALSLSVLTLGTGAALGQSYPAKTVRIVTYNPGGSNDFAARVIAQGLTASLGQPVIVENRGGGIVPIEVVSKAPADGYTLLVAGVIYTVGHLLQKTPYDPLKDFEPISQIGISPLLLVAHPSVPANSVKELIALARAKPGVLNYSSGGMGAASHLAAELFKSMAGGLKIVQVNYKSAGPAITGLMAGEVGMMFGTASAVAPHIQSGRLKALAVTSAQRSVLAPGLPTIASSGLPGYESAQLSVIVAPARTPAAIIQRLNQEIVKLLNQVEVKQRFLAVGVEAIPSSPEQVTATLKAEIARMAQVIREAGIRAE